MGLNRERLEAALKIVKSDLNQLEFTGDLERDIGLYVHIFEELESTNKTVWELMDNGAPPGTVAIAERQTSGRGQWGRQWSSPPGGLYLSVGLAPNLPVAKSFPLTLASVWGIATVLRNYHLPVLIKWPNDLILNRRKLGGILIETKVKSQVITKAVVGVGINWENSVPPTGINLQSYQIEQMSNQVALKKPAFCESLEMLGAITLWGIASGIHYMLNESEEKLLSRYSAILANLGQRVLVEGQEGTIVGVTATGDLRVEIDSPRTSPENYSDTISPDGNATPQARSHLSAASKSEILVKPGTIRLGYDTL